MHRKETDFQNVSGILLQVLATKHTTGPADATSQLHGGPMTDCRCTGLQLIASLMPAPDSRVQIARTHTARFHDTRTVQLARHHSNIRIHIDNTKFGSLRPVAHPGQVLCMKVAPLLVPHLVPQGQSTPAFMPTVSRQLPTVCFECA